MQRGVLNDPRVVLARHRLRGVHTLLFASPKGGVGKTLVSTMIAHAMRCMGVRVGLLDLDVTNPTTHLVLGLDVERIEIVEEKGVEPVDVGGIQFMSIALFTKNRLAPLRGSEVVDAIREILAITRWRDISVLVVDMPPTASDAFLEALLMFESPKIVVVATPSPLARESTRRLIEMLRSEGIAVLGLVENMGSGELKELAQRLGIEYLGFVPLDPEIDKRVVEGRVFEGTAYEHAKSVAERIARILGL